MNRIKKWLMVVLSAIIIIPSTMIAFSENTEFSYLVEDLIVYQGESQLYQVEQGNLTVVATVKNQGEASKPVLLAALCEGDSLSYLIRDMDYKNEMDFLAGEEKEVTFSLDCTDTTNKYIRIFVYDNLKFQNAIAEEVSFPTGKEGMLSGITINGNAIENFQKEDFQYMVSDIKLPLFIEVSKPISAIDVQISYPERLPGKLTLTSKLGDQTFEYEVLLKPYMDGSLEYPYYITNKGEFEKIGTGDYTLDKVYKITEDIGSTADPITKSLGSTATPFSGKIIGDKEDTMPILTFHINQTTDHQGLTAVLTGTVENVIITGKVIGRGYVGGAAGQMKGGVVKNVINKAEVYSSTDGATGKYVGGISGCADTGKNEILNCVNEGPVSLKGYGGGVGGIVGFASHADNLIQNCINKGAVTYTAGSGMGNVGGIAGYLSYGTIKLCANLAPVIATRATSSIAGGIVGLGDGSVLQSCNVGNVTSLAYAGGINGTIQYSRPVNIIDCYNTGTITASGVGGYAGGILPPNKTTASTTTIILKNTYNIGSVIGENNYFITGDLTATNSIEVSDNYYLNTLTGKTSSSYDEQGVSEQELKSLNLGENWIQGSDGSYPQLAGF